MNTWIDWLRVAGQALAHLFARPYFYIALLLAWWHSRQSVVLQRQLFHVRLRGTLPMTIGKALAGAAVGAVLSALGLAAGANLTPATLVCVWAATLVLALFRLRYICLAYAAGVLGVVQAVLSWTGSAASSGTYGEAVRALAVIDVPALLFLAGLLHIAEGLLVRWQGARYATPLFLEGKRGKPVGAYSISGVWPIPLLWLIPAASGGHTLPWTPLFGLDAHTAGWTLAAFPVLIGFSDRTATRWPENKARDSSLGLIAYGILVAALAAGAAFWPPLTLAAALAAFVLHEGLLLRGRLREKGRQPVYVQQGRGVTVLAVLPRTPAAEMGLQAGEVITKVNGMAVRDKEQLHAALQRQSAFCKLEVQNREGQLKFVQRARYEGEHYQLGLILAPDEEAEYVAAPRSTSLWRGLQQAGARMRSVAAARKAALAEARQATEETAASTERAESGANAAVAALLPPSTARADDAADNDSATANSGLPPRRARKNG